MLRFVAPGRYVRALAACRRSPQSDSLRAWLLPTSLHLHDPVRQVEVAAVRRRLKTDETLPMKEAYGALIQAILEANS